MKGNQNYFDEYSEKEAESNQITQNQAKKNNIKISLEPKESPHYFNEDYNNYSNKEKENAKANDKSASNTKKAKSSLKNQESDNAQEHPKVKNSNAKKGLNSSLNDLKDSQEDYEINDFQVNLQQEKKKTSKSKKSSSNKYSNGILEEVGNSKFIIRTNFLEDEVEENLSENANDQSKEEQNYQEDKDEVEDSQIDHKQNKNTNAFNPKKKKPVIIKLFIAKRIFSIGQFKTLSLTKLNFF